MGLVLAPGPVLEVRQKPERFDLEKRSRQLWGDNFFQSVVTGLP